jgi:hypothetical protein
MTQRVRPSAGQPRFGTVGDDFCGSGSAAAPLRVDAFPRRARADLVQRLEGSAFSGVVGGLASVAGGGKFADGAVTAAFGYLFNAAVHAVDTP